MKLFKMMSIIFAAVFFAAATCLACFDEDPGSNTGNPATTIPGEHGSSTDTTIGGNSWGSTIITHPSWPEDDPNENNEYALAVECSFPVTLNVSFSGFLDDGGEQVTEPITRMCLLYFSTAGKWIILKDIRNPQFTVVTDADGQRALFGKHTLTSSLGYTAGQTLPILLYFRTENYENFSLDDVLASSTPKPLNNTVIAIIPKNNATPF